MLNFSRWLLNEGFELPFRVIKDIYEFYKKVINEDDNGSNKRRREKVFKIDFTGTNFEFLNKLKADLKVLVGYEHNYHLTRYSTSFQHNGIYIGLVNTNPICGTIILPMLDLKSSGQKEIYEHVITIAIEHEVLHFVQDLIKVAKNLERIGGLPSPKFVKRITDIEGIDSVGDKKVPHYKRPIEFYTNMNSLINDIQYSYLYLCCEKEYDLDYCQKDKGMKKDYLNKWIDITKKQERYNFDQEYFRILIQSAYKRFVDNDDFLSKYYHIFDDENFEYTVTRNGKEYKQKGSYFETLEEPGAHE